MSPAQQDLLIRLVRADRNYWLARAEGAPCSSWDRGVEVGGINGVDPRTAESLQRLGLAEIVAGTGGHPYIYLGSVDHLKRL